VPIRPPPRRTTPHSDPLDRVLGYVAFRKATYETNPAIRDAYDRSISKRCPDERQRNPGKWWPVGLRIFGCGNYGDGITVTLH
jgi:hypothetical protein